MAGNRSQERHGGIRRRFRCRRRARCFAFEWACVGADAIGSFFTVTASGMYDTLTFTNETVEDVAGTTIITRDDASLLKPIDRRALRNT
jgi:hypothetical protein